MKTRIGGVCRTAKSGIVMLYFVTCLRVFVVKSSIRKLAKTIWRTLAAAFCSC